VPNGCVVIFLLFTVNSSGDPVKANDMVGACVSYGGGEMSKGFLTEEPEGNRPLERRGN